MWFIVKRRKTTAHNAFVLEGTNDGHEVESDDDMGFLVLVTNLFACVVEAGETFVVVLLMTTVA